MSAGDQNRNAGAKRRGDDSIISEQRLAKRFHLLNLDNKNESLWIPNTAISHTPATPEIPAQHRETDAASPMQIDDTKDRIYIRNLDEELAFEDDVRDEDRIVFLSDIEKKLSKIPKHVLMGEGRPRTAGNELVLYGVPSSLTVPVEKDNVRRAILESRARAAEKASRDALLHDDEHDPEETPKPFRGPSSENLTEQDGDAMEIG